MAYRWERFEAEVLDRLAAEARRRGRRRMSLTAVSVADLLGVSRWEATLMIQSYLGAQRRRRVRGGGPAYVLKRQGRTRSAVWSVGVRSDDARVVLVQFKHDVRRTISRALAPDLRRIGELNPRALPVVEGATEHAIRALEETLEGIVAMASLAKD